MILKGRLKLIADMVPECNIVCDIGTDHAYIPIYISENKKCKKALASDVKKDPVIIARKNVESYGLSQSIEVRQGNGLEPISEDEIDVIIIAGMGGMLIREILGANINKVRKARSIILQPMNSIEVVRQWLYENGIYIYDEELVAEGFKIYNVIAAKWNGVVEKKDEIYFYIGEKLIEKKDPLLEKYIENKINQIEKAEKEMDKMKDKECETKKRFTEVKSGLINILNNTGNKPNFT